MNNKFVRAVFPGSFDPITNGHLDVIERSSGLFDEIVIGVGDSSQKEYMFTGGERLEMIRQITVNMPNVRAERFSGLTVDFAREMKANAILRGLRDISDVQYEFQLALTNRTLSGIETVFIMTSETKGFISSTLIREVARHDGDVSGMVPECVAEMLIKKLGK
ncbi:MAG: pantetheine-phosphate adenylyltransferase [Sedimentisphaerales bacterium]|nr:pantetheine-phosphate adenylyltransferase [Sedimentisphaerales bacterium]MBN2841657.1 pantetheine-phosphate adenylyltransferase [Sedimentisphaerales bacterium]